MSLFPTACLSAAAALLDACRGRHWHIATAESCTGGLLGACLTEHPGASAVVACGWITYANEAKIALLGVAPATLAAEGAVSETTAREMAEGAQTRAGCDLAIAVTGIAGPGGGTATKPVGLVHIAVATHSGISHERHVFAGDRTAVRLASVAAALRLALRAADATG